LVQFSVAQKHQQGPELFKIQCRVEGSRGKAVHVNVIKAYGGVKVQLEGL
jgi:hypothetical protein